MNSTDVRSKLVEALESDLVGPRPGLGNPTEKLEQSPSRWYLTGFLVPLDADESQAVDAGAEEEVSQGSEEGGLDDDAEAERAQVRTQRLPSSIGMSVLLPPETRTVQVTVRWGDYRGFDLATSRETWVRQSFEKAVSVPIGQTRGRTRAVKVPGSDGVEVAYLVRRLGIERPEVGLPADAWTVSLFLVNRRVPASDDRQDHRAT